MPEPTPDPYLDQTRRVAYVTIAAGVGITLLKFGVFFVTGSMGVLSDGVESVANILAALVMLQAIRLASAPPDESHPYGRGNIEFMAVLFEGLLVVGAALGIAVTAVLRFVQGHAVERLDLGTWLMAGVSVLTGVLAWYVWSRGRRFDNATLRADGRHLATDTVTTVGVLVGLIVVRATGWAWVDTAVALLLSALILVAGWGLLREGFDGLMSKADPEDDAVILEILDRYREQGDITGYHKVRHRHTGPFHWVDMHVQVDGGRTVADGHALASQIEGEIERALGRANATTHIEPG